MAEEKANGEICKILELPEYVLTILFSYLDTTSLYQLTRTCLYLKSFIEVPIFWRYVDARRDPNTDKKVQYCTDRLHEKTTHILFRAKDRICGQVPSNFFDIINPFQNLRVLALENQRFSGSKLSLRDFPGCLEELSLKKTQIKGAEMFFQQSNRNMQKLRVLILDGCKWVTCSFLMSVAKYNCLEIVSAVKCVKLHIDMVPYLSVAKFWCRTIKVIDCRFTGIGHELLRTFYSKPDIQCLYFQGAKSAETDYSEKIYNNAYMRTAKDDDNLIDSNVCDVSLYEYINTIASNSIEPIADSLLYKDPYPKCTCSRGDEDPDLDASKPNAIMGTEDYYHREPPRSQRMKFVCHKHFKDVQKLPPEFKKFFITNQKQFYVDLNSDQDSDSESTDSDGENCCCMYGMGRKMIFLTPTSNRELHQEILELNRDDRRPTVNIFVANPLLESSSPDPNNAVAGTSRQEQAPANAEDRAVPGTSRGGQRPLFKFLQGKLNAFPDRPMEHMESSSGEAKRRQREPRGDSPNKKRMRKADEDLGQLSDEDHAAQVDELVESAAVVGNRLNEFVESNMEAIRGQPSTSSTSPECPPQHFTRFRASTGNSETIRDRLLIRDRFSQAARDRIVLINQNYPHLKASKKKIGLRRLSLRGFRKVTDVALDYIKNLNIDLLDLTYTSVTRQGIENFLLSNPNCRIIHPLYCICKPINPLE